MTLSATAPGSTWTPAPQARARWTGVFWRVAGDACAVIVFTGEQNDACEDIIKVYVHQWWLFREGEEGEGKAVWPKALCMYQDVPFAAYSVTGDYFLTPGRREQIERARRHREEVREAQERKKGAAGQLAR